MVLAADVFGPSEGVLVEPGDFAVPVDGAVDALAGRGARVAVVGLCAVELFSAAFVHRVTCRDFEFQAFDDFPSESGVGVEVVDYGLAVLVLSCFHRVETVVVCSRHFGVHKVVIEVVALSRAQRFHRSVAPD